MRARPSALNGRQVRHLRALAHHIDPLILVGKEGVTDAVIRASWQALHDHELIKVRLPQVGKDERRDMAMQLRRALAAHVVDEIGRVVILYRPRPDKPKIDLPR